MNISLQELSLIMQEFTGLSAHLLDSFEQRQAFCRSYRFHTLQLQLTPEAMEGLLQDLARDTLLLLTDCFRVRYLLAWIEESALCIGPFCTEIFSEQEWGYLLPPQQLASIPLGNLSAYRSQFPVMDQNQALQNAMVFLKLASGGTRVWRTAELDLSAAAKAVSAEQALQSQSDLLEARYHVEQQMYAALANGRATDAVRLYRQLEQHLAYLRHGGYTLANSLIGACMVRNTARLVAYHCGLPALVLDQISIKSRTALAKAGTVEEVTALVEQMLRDFSGAIYRQKDRQYSKLIHAMLYAVEHSYRQELTVADLAVELDVSADTLIRHCKQETGMTPGAYIRKVRMEKAAQLLRESPRPIQEISTAVGILDANYFVKLFKQEFGQTPSAYRAERLL